LFASTWAGQESDLEAEGGKGAHDGDEQDVDVGNENDGALVGDDLAHASIGEGTPLVDVKNLVGVRDEAVALEVSSEGHEEHAEHGVATVPALSVSGHTETAAGELGVALGELDDGIRHGAGLLHHDACLDEHQNTDPHTRQEIDDAREEKHSTQERCSKGNAGTERQTTTVQRRKDAQNTVA
jgi:hypothetical protein